MEQEQEALKCIQEYDPANYLVCVNMSFYRLTIVLERMKSPFNLLKGPLTP